MLKRKLKAMINKINNNISFKGVYFFPNINNMSEKNKSKAGVFAKIVRETFPCNDIFLGADECGELYMRVQKSNPLHLLMDEEIARRLNLSPIQLAHLINLLTDLKSAQNKIRGIQEPYVLDKTEHIDDLDELDLTYQFCRVIDLFNKTHKELEN